MPTDATSCANAQAAPQSPGAEGNRRWLPVVRTLTRAFQAFERLSDAHVRQLGLTGPQFDIIATLGNTAGMSCGELGERTLITKGTLTGVLDRLVARGLVARCNHASDGRSRLVHLTTEGQALFEQIFPAHLAHCARAFDGLSDEQLQGIQRHCAMLLTAIEGQAAPAPVDNTTN